MRFKSLPSSHLAKKMDDQHKTKHLEFKMPNPRPTKTMTWTEDSCALQHFLARMRKRNSSKIVSLKRRADIFQKYLIAPATNKPGPIQTFPAPTKESSINTTSPDCRPIACARHLQVESVHGPRGTACQTRHTCQKIIKGR